MDATVFSPQTHNWELLAQLALCGQHEVVTHDANTFVQTVADVLKRHLHCSWGVLVAADGETSYARAIWGQAAPAAAHLHDLSAGDERNSHPFVRIPLRVGNETMGYLVLPHNEDDPLSDLARSDPLAGQLGLLLYAQRQHHTRQTSPTGTPSPITPGPAPQSSYYLSLLERVSEVTTTSQDNEQIYQMVLEMVAQVTGAYQTSLVIYDRLTHTASIVSSYYRDGTTPADTDQRSFSLHDNPATEWLDTNYRPLISYDAQHDPLLQTFRPYLQHHNIGSLILFPLRGNSQVLGWVEVAFVGNQGEPLSEHTLKLSQSVACQVSRVVENMLLSTQANANAQALQEKVGELSTLLEAAQILGSLLQPDEVLNNLMYLVSRQLNVSTVALWTIGEDNILAPAAMDGTPLEMSRAMRVPVGKGLTGRVAAMGLPLVVDDVEQDGNSLYPGFNRTNNLTSFMGVPVFYRERIIGVLSVMTMSKRKFTHDEVMLMIGLAGQAAIALENARLFQERERRIAELTTLNKISSAVNASLQLDEILLTLHHSISEVLDTTYSFIGFYDVATTGESAVLHQRVIRDAGMTHLSDYIIPIDGYGLVDYIFFEGTPLLLNTAQEIAETLETWHPTLGDGSSERMLKDNLTVVPESWLGVPVVRGGDVLGLINIQSATPYAYSEDDMRFLSTVAGQAAVGIANARLFNEKERRLREITVLKDIGSSISSTLDLQSVLERLYLELGQVLDMSTAIIGLYDELSNQLSYPVCYDQGQRIYLDPTPLSEGPSGWAIRNRQPLLLHTLEQAKQMGIKDFGVSIFDLRSGQSKIRLPRSRSTQSFLVTPIFSGDTVLGVINIKSYKPYAFDEDDLRFLITVANQVAITISNVRLFSERERRIRELATFNEIGQALSSTVSFEELPMLIYRQTSRLIDTTNFYMALLDYERHEITFPLFYEQGINRQMEQARTQETGKIGSIETPINHSLYIFIVHLTRRVVQKREPLLLGTDDFKHEEWSFELREELGPARSQNVLPSSWLGVPMVVADKVIGVIGLYNYEHPNTYGNYDVRLLSTIASWAAIALENARLFEQISNFATSLERSVAERTWELQKANAQLHQEKDYLETVHTITLELTASLDLDEIISRSLEIASTNLEVSRGSIMLRELQTGTLMCRAVLHERGNVHRVEQPISFGSSEGLVGWVMQQKESVRIDDVRKDPRWVIESGRADDVRSVAAAPLMTSDSTLGVLILSSPRESYFTDSHLRLLATIANEVAIAINNAQLYSYITDMATRLADLLEHQKEENSKSRAILQSLTEGVIVFDQDQQIELVNWAAEHVLNIPAHDVLEKPFEMLTSYGNTEEKRTRAWLLYENLRKGLGKVQEQQSAHNMSVELTSPTQTVSVNIAPVVGHDGQRYGDVAVLRDVTREIQADQAKREFVSNVSHELRTPLTSIRGYIDLLLLGSMGPLNNDQVGFLTVVKTNANRLMDLINDILDISRLDAGKIRLDYSPFDIREVIHDAARSLRLEAEAKDLDVLLEIPDELPPVNADKKRITQVVFNLFSNAVKYTYRGGTFVVRTFLNPARMMQVEVEDTGVGMSPEQMENLFRPFYRAENPLREEAGGTGLGLSIARSLVEQHGGEMWVTSEVGKGSTFYFIIPLERPTRSEADEDNE